MRRLKEDGVLALPPQAEDVAAEMVDALEATSSGNSAAKTLDPPVEETVKADREHPETVTIRDAGEYEIDVEGLLNASPIVIQKDGVFMIHLPSVFDSGRSRRRRR